MRKDCIARDEADPENPPMGVLRSRPWLIVVAAFVILITAWSVLVEIGSGIATVTMSLGSLQSVRR